MISVKVAGIERLKASLGDKAKKLPQEVAIAVNATAKFVNKQMAKDIQQELATSQKVIGKTIRQTRRATKAELKAMVRLEKTTRIPLKDFGARQTKKGVSYKVSKTKGRGFVPGGFQGPKPGAMKASWRGNAFKRVGKARLPIVKLKGPSPWGVFVKRGMTADILKRADAELEKQVERRVRYNVLKSQGVI